MTVKDFKGQILLVVKSFDGRLLLFVPEETFVVFGLWLDFE